MKLRPVIISLFTSLIMMVGCSSIHLGLPKKPGWQKFPTLRTYDKPGTIIGVSKDGAWNRIMVLPYSENLGGKEPGFTYTEKVSLSAILGQLMIDVKELNVNLNASSGKSYELTFRSDEQINTEILGLDDPVFKKAFNEWLMSHRPIPNLNYYLIIATDAAKKIYYQLDSKFIFDIGGEAKWRNFVNGNAKLIFSDISEYRVVETKDGYDSTYFRFRYLAFPIKIRAAGVGGIKLYGIEKTYTNIPHEKME